jgi:serine/threonine-protein kinase RsbW
MNFERRIKIVAMPENVSAACEVVVAAARDAGLNERAVHHCRLAVDEACTNIIEHGFGSNPVANHTIEIVCGQRENDFFIVIEDDGAPFDPTQFPDPDATVPMEAREPGGWGVFFIKKMMDHVTYERVSDRNRLMLIKQIIPSPPDDEPQPAAQIYAPPPVDPIRVAQITPKIAMIIPNGRVDLVYSKALDNVIQRELGGGRRSLIINLANVDYLSSAGMKVLVSAWQRTRDVRGELVLCALNSRVREVLSIVGLDLVFSIVDTPQAAVERLKGKR